MHIRIGIAAIRYSIEIIEKIIGSIGVDWTLSRLEAVPEPFCAYAVAIEPFDIAPGWRPSA